MPAVGQDQDVHFIECGLIDGVSWIHGLGYQPHIALYQDPLLLRRKMERFGVRFSQLDAAYPLSGRDGPLYGVPYVLSRSPGPATPAARASPPPTACTSPKGSPMRRRWS